MPFVLIFCLLKHIVGSICDSISEFQIIARCPNQECRKFVPDFEACSALMCGEHGVAGQINNGCGTRFCAWCLIICEDEHKTHDHVRKCPFNPNK
jgi:hypothetical protein